MSVTYTLVDNSNGKFILEGKNLKLLTQLASGTSYSVIIRATDSNGWTKDVTASILTQGVAVTPVSISGSLPNGYINTAFTFTPTVNNGSGTKTYSLTGSLPSGLSFSSSTGAISGTSSSAQVISNLAITVTDSSGSATLSNLTLRIIDTTAPVITSASVYSIAENNPLVINLTSNVPCTFSKVGGSDASAFTLNTSNNTLSLAMQDFENPLDSNGDNSFVVQVRATDANGNASSQTITVSITNILEGTRATLTPLTATMSPNVSSGTTIFDFPALVEGESRAVNVSWLSFNSSGDLTRNVMSGPVGLETVQNLPVVVTTSRLGETDTTYNLTVTIPSSAINVTNQTELTSALNTVTGGEIIRVAYNATPYSISKENLAPTSEVKITSADSSNPAIFNVIGKSGSTGGLLAGWKNITIDGVKFDRTAIDYATKQQYVANVNLASPSYVNIKNNSFKGRAIARWPGDTNPNNVVKGDMGIRLTSPKNCRIENNTASGYSFWLQSLGDGQDDNVATLNKIKNGQMDYMQFVGGGKGWTVTYNDLSEFYGSINEYQSDSGNHDDGIQFSTSGSLTGWDYITIERNFVDGGGNDGPQGIFVKDENLKGIRNLSIQHNAIRTSQTNGIGVNANNGPGIPLVVSYNLVLWTAVPNDPVDPQLTNVKPLINLLNGCTGTYANNMSGGYSSTSSTLTSTGNLTINYIDPTSSLYAENLFPGSLATGVDKYRIREARLATSYTAGPDIIKRNISTMLNRIAGVMSGQSNAEYFARDSRIEFQSYINSLSPNDISYTLTNGATEGSALLEVNKPTRATYYWWDDALNAPGPRYDIWNAAVDSAVANGRTVAFTIWNQGEGDAFFVGASDAQATRYFNALQALFSLMRTKVPGLRIFIAPMNRRDGDTSATSANYINGFDKLRDFHASYCAANPTFMTLLPEMYDQIGDGGAHSLNDGYDADAIRFARKIAKTYGYTVSGGVDGPRLIAAVRNGTTVTFEFAHDGGTTLTPTSGGAGLYYFANNVSIALSNVTVADATHVTATLASTPANGATEVAEFGYGILSGVDYTKILRDNQVPALAVRHGKVTPSIVAVPDTTAPTITSSSTGSTANNTAYTKTLTANENVTFAKTSGDQTSAFTLSDALLSLPATTTAGTYICNLSATDTAGNVTNFTHTVTVAAAVAATPVASSVWTNTLFNRRALNSSGQNIPNQIASPADGSSQSAYDAYLGSSTSVSSDDPVYTAASGGVPAYFRNNGSQNIQTVATDFLKNLSVDRVWTYATLMKAPSSWTAGAVPVIFGCGGSTASVPGIQLRYIVNTPSIRVATSNGSTTGQINFAQGLPTTGYIMIVMAYDPTNRIVTIYLNSSTPVTNPSNSSLNGGVSTGNFIISQNISDGSGWIEDVMATGTKTASDITALKDYWQNLYNISIF